MSELVIGGGDGYVAAVKPVGVISQDDGTEECMVRLLRRETGREVYPVHRLDRAVGGVMIYALRKDTASLLQTPGAMTKEYIAVVHGETEDSGEWRDLLFKDSKTNKSFVVKRMRRGVREAALSFVTKARADSLSLVEIKLGTGRSHQIRVQFSSRRHPLVGDGKYGASDGCPIALFSRRITLSEEFFGGASFEALPESVYPWDKFDLPKQI